MTSRWPRYTGMADMLLRQAETGRLISPATSEAFQRGQPNRAVKVKSRK